MEENTNKNKKSKSKSKPKTVSKPKIAKVVEPKVTKTVENVSLQSWPVPTGNGKEVFLVPGASVEIPLGAITNRLINLHKRRLVSIR